MKDERLVSKMEGKTNFSKCLNHSLMAWADWPLHHNLQQIYATESTHNQSPKISVKDFEKPPAIEEQTDRVRIRLGQTVWT